MMHSLVSRSALLTAFLLAGSALAQGAVIKDNHLKFNGKSYFRAGSESVELGSYGEKKTPIAKANYLEVQGHVARDKLVVRTATIVDIDFKQSTEKDFKANVLAGAVGGSVDTAYKRLDKGELKLVKFEVELVDMKKALNDSPIVRDNLDKYGGDARVCHQIFVVLEASIATKISSSTSLAVAGTTGGVTVTAKGKTKDEKDTTVTLSKGTTFAYLLAKMDWDKKNGDKVVEKLTDDQFSLN